VHILHRVPPYSEKISILKKTEEYRSQGQRQPELLGGGGQIRISLHVGLAHVQCRPNFDAVRFLQACKPSVRVRSNTTSDPNLTLTLTLIPTPRSRHNVLVGPMRRFALMQTDRCVQCDISSHRSGEVGVMESGLNYASRLLANVSERASDVNAEIQILETITLE